MHLAAWRTVKLKHAWVLGFIMVLYVAWTAPVALQSMALVSAKVWFGALSGYWIDKALFDYARPDGEDPVEDWMYRRAIIVAACILGLAMGV